MWLLELTQSQKNLWNKKLTCAHLKVLSNRRIMVFSFLKYLLSFQSCSKTDDVTNSFSTKINHKIKNILGNIGVMLLKLGTSNVPHVRHKLTPSVLMPLRQFCFRVFFILIFCLNQTPFTPNELVRRYRAIWVLCAFQVGLSASPLLFEYGDIWFIAERNWGSE